jgi:hypothetical protein
VIAQHFDRTDLLADNRDAYVAAARSQRRDYDLDLLVSSPRSMWGVATKLIDELTGLGMRVHRSISGDPELLDQANDPARHLCLVVDEAVTRWQVTEAETFLRHTLDAGDDRQLFCVLTRGTDQEALPAFLRNLRPLRLDAGVPPRHVARQLHRLITDAPLSRADVDREALVNAAAALRKVPEELAHRGRWPLIEATVRDMVAALAESDLDSLQDLTVDLELLNQVRASGNLIAAPGDLRRRVTGLLGRIDRRMNVFTD